MVISQRLFMGSRNVRGSRRCGHHLCHRVVMGSRSGQLVLLLVVCSHGVVIGIVVSGGDG